MDPNRIFNFDEVAIHLHPDKVKNVISRKGAKNVYSINGNSKECVTVLLGGNAVGRCPPALVIFKGERMPRGLVANDSIVVDKSPSGWMNGETFLKYIAEDFTRWIRSQKVELPVIVFIDGHSSHLTLPLCEFCHQNGIILIALLPNATHIYQPMDIGVIFPLKAIWKRKRIEWKSDINNVGVVFARANFLDLLQKSMVELQANPTLFPNAFRTCGN